MSLKFENGICSAIDNMKPKKVKRINKKLYKLWFNKDILDLTKLKKDLWRIYKIGRTTGMYNNYRNVNNRPIQLSRNR